MWAKNICSTKLNVCTRGLYGFENHIFMKKPNLFIYQARESSLDPVGFLTAQFLQKLWFMKPLF